MILVSLLSPKFAFECSPSGCELRRRDTSFETPCRLRKQIVEPVFGQIKQARGFRRFLLWGVERARTEWALISAAHNLTELARAAKPSPRRPAASYRRNTGLLAPLSGRAPMRTPQKLSRPRAMIVILLILQ